MFRKFVWLFVVLPAGVILVAFAAANRHDVRFNFNPLTTDGPDEFQAPLFLFILGAFFAGLIIGGIVTWFGQGKWRKEAKVKSRESASLRAETEQLNEQLRAAQTPRIESSEAAE